MSILIFAFLMITGTTFAQTFNMQYNKVSANEVHITTVYRGPSAEISLPRTGRIISLSEQENLNAGGGKIRVGIRVGDNSSTEEHVVRFTYSLIIPNQGGFGALVDKWYPTLKEGDAEYNITSLKSNTEIFVYPYLSYQTNTFLFSSVQPSVKLAILQHSMEEHLDATPEITIFSTKKLQASPQDIRTIHQYISENFGDKNIRRIVVVNTILASENSFIDDDTLYLNITGIGTRTQIKDAFALAWKGANDSEKLSTRLFTIFQDTIFRLLPIHFNTTAPIATTETTENSELTNTSETTTPKLDMGATVLVPPVTYYQELFNKGFEINEIQHVDIDGILNNYALLHMAQYNIGAENLVAGIRAYFNNTNEAPVTSSTSTNSDVENETTNSTANTNTNSTETLKSLKDTEKVDWSLITQNKLQEPLFSLYTKEVLIEKGIVPTITAKGTTVTRNSYNIPDFNLLDAEGKVIPVQWNEFRSVNIQITNGNYQLDSERSVPQQRFLDSYYSFDTNTQTLRNRILAMSFRQKAPGEINTRKQLELTQFTAEDGNAFNIPAGDQVFVVISHILSNTTGALKQAIKESFYTVDNDGNITYLTTRLRV